MTEKKQFYILLALTLTLGVVMAVIGRELLSLWISLVCAYLLRRPYIYLTKHGLNSVTACAALVVLFMFIIVLLLLVIIPPMLSEAYNFLSTLPDILAANQASIATFVDKISAKVPISTINDLIFSAKQYLTVKSTDGVLFIINLLPITFEILLYFILVPLMLFFLLKDGIVFANYFQSIIPECALVTSNFWKKLDAKLGSYLQGKVIEMLIVGTISLIVYGLFNMKYALLMAGVMAVSVLIPVLGSIFATIPIVFIALWQFGPHSHTAIYLLVAHGIILIADGNILVPLLFSDKLCLHPLVILVGILLFGSIMGFWGLFFAIPLLVVISLFLENFRLAFNTNLNVKTSNA